MRLMRAPLGSDKETTCGGYTAIAIASLATAGVREGVCAWKWQRVADWIKPTPGENVYLLF